MTDPGRVSTVATPAEDVCARIRRCVISGEYAAGQRLTEEELARQHGVSRMSVREALRVLAAEGFIDVRPYFGTFVTELTSKQAGDLLEVQGALEPLAAGLAAGRRTAEHISELRAIVEEGRQAARAGRAEEASALHGRFHARLAAASGNDALSGLIVQLRDKIDWVYAARVRRPPGDSWEEHADMVDAIEKGDASLAVEAAQAHIRHAVPRAVI
jgi:DNA-binding GntR family transcriptional regulator